MSLKNIKANNQGFTIVELLIVVVVIAILAAITIVSYNGITNRANASSSKSTASTVQKKIELYNADKGNYPINKAALTAANETFTLDAATFGGSAPTASTTGTKGTNYVRVQTCRNVASATAISTSNIVGMRISYWDYEKAAGSEIVNIDLGTCPSTTIADIS